MTEDGGGCLSFCYIGGLWLGLEVFGRPHGGVPQIGHPNTSSPSRLSVQVDLGMNNLLRLRELESDLTRGRSNEALAKVRFDSHTQMHMLSSLYKEFSGTWVVENVIKRDAELPEKLAQFQPKTDAWIEPKCSK